MTTADLPPSITTNVISFNIASFSIYAPSNTSMAAPGSAIEFQGSNDGATWVTLYSTTIRGTNAEVITSISSNLTTGNFQNHRIALAGGSQPIACAQAQFNVAVTGVNEE